MIIEVSQSFLNRNPNVFIPGSVHAAKHVIISLAPIFFMCNEGKLECDCGNLSSQNRESSSFSSFYFTENGNINLLGSVHQFFHIFLEYAINYVIKCECLMVNRIADKRDARFVFATLSAN